MTLIKLVEKEEATGKVAEIYEAMNNMWGMIPEAFRLYSPSEILLSQQYNNLMFYSRHPTIGNKLQAFIRLLVSEKEECKYCVGMNTGMLFHYGVLPEMIEEIKKDPSTAPLDDKEKAMLLFVLKLVQNSNSIEQKDVDELKKLGWSDAEILEASYHGAMQTGTDKLFNAFKIQL